MCIQIAFMYTTFSQVQCHETETNGLYFLTAIGMISVMLGRHGNFESRLSNIEYEDTDTIFDFQYC